MGVHARRTGPVVEEGDSIYLDIPHRTLTLEVDEAELAARRTRWIPPEPKARQGYLVRYARIVTSANTGAILKV